MATVEASSRDELAEIHPWETETSRRTNACITCRRRKVKCSGTHPCSACIRHKAECAFEQEKRRNYAESYVNGLLEKIQHYEDLLHTQSQDDVEARTPQSALQNHCPDTSGGPIVTPLGEHQLISNTEGAIPCPSQTVQASSPDTPSDRLSTQSFILGQPFESRVKQVLGKRPRRDASPFGDENRPQSRPSNATYTHVSWYHTPYSHSVARDTPTEEEAYRLLDVFVSSMGISQHFFDQRTFSDAVAELYHPGPAGLESTEHLWFVEFLVVIAIAQLVEGHSHSGIPPGVSNFLEAIRRLPDLGQLRKEGVLAVEILALIAVYYQCCDRKEDAYVHAGLAMRIALSIGINRKAADKQLRRSEITHINRLMWTVYMLDRRLAAATGCPPAVNDDQLQIDEPSQCLGFPSPSPLLVNIRIAKTTSEIMRNLYGSTQNTESECIREVQKLLRSLYEIANFMPPELVIDFASPRFSVSRTAASLYLWLFQAIILSVRPVVLHMVQCRVHERQEILEPQPFAPILVRLSRTCLEAATKSLKILYSLKEQGLLAMFGYFDLDATFSVAFILIMTSIIHGPSPHHSIHEASLILEHMAGRGNEAAESRRKDIIQMCKAVWPSYDEEAVGTSMLPPPLQRQSRANLGVPRASVGNSDDAQRHGRPCGALRSGPQPPSPMPAHEETHLGAEPQNAVSGQSSASLLWADSLDTYLFNDFEGLENAEGGGILSMYNDPTLPLTGVDTSDWEEMESLLLR